MRKKPGEGGIKVRKFEVNGMCVREREREREREKKNTHIKDKNSE